MKLYRVKYHDIDHGVCFEWFTSKEASGARIRELNKGRDPQLEALGEWEAIDVPTRRAGLVSFLNLHAGGGAKQRPEAP